MSAVADVQKRSRWHSAPWWAGVSGIVAIIAALISTAAWWLPRSSDDPVVRRSADRSSSSLSASQTGDPIRATLLMDPDGIDDNSWATSKILSRSQIASLPAPNDFDQLGSSIANLGGIKASAASLKLVVETEREDKILITNMKARILSTTQLPSGTLLCNPPQGDMDNTVIGFNLDSARAIAQAVKPDSGIGVDALGEPFFAGRHVQLTRGEKHLFQIYALASRAAYEWDIEISIVVNGHTARQVVQLSGSPMRLTGIASVYSAVYGYALSSAYDDNGQPNDLYIGQGWQAYDNNLCLG